MDTGRRNNQRAVPKPTALYFQGVRQHFAMQVMACKMNFVDSDVVMEADGSRLFEEYSKDAGQENAVAPDAAQWDAWLTHRFEVMARRNENTA